jgi:outer membrane immunogenic protein
MRKVVLGTVLLALVALVALGTAAAADDSLYSPPPTAKAVVTTNSLPSPALPSPPPSNYSWSGWYGGVNVGWGIGRADNSVNPLPDAATFINLKPTVLSPSPGGPLGGFQFGYQCERGHFVFGPVVDFDWTGMNGQVFQTPIIQNDGTAFPLGGFLLAQQNTKWVGSIRGKFGVLIRPRFLIYGTGGYAYGRVDFSANTNFLPVGTEQYPANFSKVKTGWIAGGGGEFAIGSIVRIGGEYLYYDLGTESFTANPSIPFPPSFPPFQVNYTWDTKAHIMRGFLNLKF